MEMIRKYPERSMSRSHFLHYKSHLDRPGIESAFYGKKEHPIPYLQQSLKGPRPESEKASPQLPTYLLNNDFNLILPPTAGSPKQPA
jgi:hypothetical protein